jgi:ribosomal protein S27AE
LRGTISTGLLVLFLVMFGLVPVMAFMRRRECPSCGSSNLYSKVLVRRVLGDWEVTRDADVDRFRFRYVKESDNFDVPSDAKLSEAFDQYITNESSSRALAYQKNPFKRLEIRFAGRRAEKQEGLVAKFDADYDIKATDWTCGSCGYFWESIVASREANEPIVSAVGGGP